MSKSSAAILNGAKIAEAIKLDLAKKIAREKTKPGLAAILVGNDRASELYIQLKEDACLAVGLNFHKYLCNQECCENITENDLLSLIEFLNQDKAIDGIIVQLPLPKKYSTQKIINAINPRKDVDGFHPKNTQVMPPTIAGILELLTVTKKNLKNKKALVIGKSDIFIAGLAGRLKKLGLKIDQAENKIPTDSENYDVIIVALGKAGILKKSMVKTGAIVIDVGINKVKNRIVGDVDEAVKEKAGFVSPVPGGVGPLTVACLLRNTYLLSKK